MIGVVTASRILIQLSGLRWMDRPDGRGLFDWRRFGLVRFLQIIDDRLNDRWWNDGWLNSWGLLRFLVHGAFPF